MIITEYLCSSATGEENIEQKLYFTSSPLYNICVIMTFTYFIYPLHGSEVPIEMQNVFLLGVKLKAKS